LDQENERLLVSFHRLWLSFSVFLSALIPSQKQLMWLILIVLYLPQLRPEVKNEKAPASPIWQKSDEFWGDYNWAKKSALELMKHLASEDSSYQKEFEKQEGVFLNICARMHQMDPNAAEVKSRSFHTL
jgi:hypothetical protein